MHTPLLVTLGFAVLATFPLCAQAQTPASIPPAAALERVSPGSFLRVRASDERVEGRFERTTLDSLYLSVRTFSLSAVDSVWVRGRRTAQGAWIGGTFGLVGGALLGVLMEGICQLPGSSCQKGVLIASAAVGTTIGAIVGAGIGSRWTTWRRIYP